MKKSILIGSEAVTCGGSKSTTVFAMMQGRGSPPPSASLAITHWYSSRFEHSILKVDIPLNTVSEGVSGKCKDRQRYATNSGKLFNAVGHH